MTPALRYVAGLYESCIDRDLDTEAVRLYLLSRGVARSPAQVAYDLNHVFCFTGYAASHPPAPARTVKEWDRAIDQAKLRLQLTAAFVLLIAGRVHGAYALVPPLPRSINACNLR